MSVIRTNIKQICTSAMNKQTRTNRSTSLRNLIAWHTLSTSSSQTIYVDRLVYQCHLQSTVIYWVPKVICNTGSWSTNVHPVNICHVCDAPGTCPSRLWGGRGSGPISTLKLQHFLSVHVSQNKCIRRVQVYFST